jgi:uncharacterized Zn finger protein
MISHSSSQEISLRCSRGPKEAYLENYRATVTRPKLEAAERILARWRSADNLLDSVPLVTTAIIAQLKQASEHLSCLVPYIHDLWSEGMFGLSCSAGADREIFLSNQFLKPLGDFTDEERAFEETLAAMDIHALTAVAEEMLDVGHDSHADSVVLALRSTSDKELENVVSALARIAESDAFMSAAMRPIHENWVRACCLHRRGGWHLEFEDLNDFHLSKLYNNARADILGVLLFSEDGKFMPSAGNRDL